ncbi:hypothetical protein GCM10010178_32270 [Lentzea flava]|uniref:Uncharacterized protein n=1 Tax=Lentzea flava TaxID=103732 RepID=A0ABQ2UIL8_9PSEU|nr:hypothetical protein GCM10010178_32270 [Lentzea flava]
MPDHRRVDEHVQRLGRQHPQGGHRQPDHPPRGNPILHSPNLGGREACSIPLAMEATHLTGQLPGTRRGADRPKHTATADQGTKPLTSPARSPAQDAAPTAPKHTATADQGTKPLTSPARFATQDAGPTAPEHAAKADDGTKPLTSPARSPAQERGADRPEHAATDDHGTKRSGFPGPLPRALPRTREVR